MVGDAPKFSGRCCKPSPVEFSEYAPEGHGIWTGVSGTKFRRLPGRLGHLRAPPRPISVHPPAHIPRRAASPQDLRRCAGCALVCAHLQRTSRTSELRLHLQCTSRRDPAHLRAPAPPGHLPAHLRIPRTSSALRAPLRLAPLVTFGSLPTSHLAYPCPRTKRHGRWDQELALSR